MGAELPLSFSGRKEWRGWLSRHHGRKTGVWPAIFKKGSEKPGLRYEEAVEEALCFG